MVVHNLEHAQNLVNSKFELFFKWKLLNLVVLIIDFFSYLMTRIVLECVCLWTPTSIDNILSKTDFI